MMSQATSMAIRMCTFYIFLSDRLVYMILRGQIYSKHQRKKFFGGAKAQISRISKSIALST